MSAFTHVGQTSIYHFAVLAQLIELLVFGLRYKETDRIVALRDELERMGAKVECTESEFDNELHIFPSELHPEKNVIRTYGDHRMALSFSLLAMKYGKITLDDKEVVNKSFPGFWQVLKRLGAKL